MEKPTELGDVKEYRLAHETLERVKSEMAATETEMQDVDQRLKSRSLEIEADAVLSGEFDLSENGNLRSRYNDLVALRKAQQAAIQKQQAIVNQAATRASVQICDAHRDEYRALVEQTRDAAEELQRLTKVRQDMHGNLKTAGVNWYLPVLRLLELDTRLPALLSDCDEGLAELSKGED